MKISIIIPTHNRSDLLKNAIDSIITLKEKVDFEFVIVDNNSSDKTKEIVSSYSSLVKYVFEGRTAFTRARRTGEENASGEILLYIDDDVILRAGSLTNIIEIFKNNHDCGVIAGKIDPLFVEAPPQWTLECQKSFNGWSLYNPETCSVLSKDFQEVSWAAGPMMAIRRSCYNSVGGFPPDTVGVETNKGAKSFNKLYIGPGDYGLCYKIKEIGYKIYYSSSISCYHVISPVRFTVAFWRSRMIGEGYHIAITQREFFQMNKIKLFKEYFAALGKYFDFEHKLGSRLQSTEIEAPNSSKCHSVYPEELWVHYYKAYLDMYFVLEKYPSLSKYLWEIGHEGVNDENFDRVTREFPKEYQYLVSNETVYADFPMDVVSLNNYKRKSYFYTHLNPMLKNNNIRNTLMLSLNTARTLKQKISHFGLFERTREG